MGGEHAKVLATTAGNKGSPPHGRGAPLGDRHRRRLPRLTPAWAGSTRARCRFTAVFEAHPRMGGEHDLDRLVLVGSEGSPPHGRGAHVEGLRG